jgi:hypothetical protein
MLLQLRVEAGEVVFGDVELDLHHWWSLPTIVHTYI